MPDVLCTAKKKFHRYDYRTERQDVVHLPCVKLYGHDGDHACRFPDDEFFVWRNDATP